MMMAREHVIDEMGCTKDDDDWLPTEDQGS
jgi:hypothetical protein